MTLRALPGGVALLCALGVGRVDGQGGRPLRDALLERDRAASGSAQRDGLARGLAPALGRDALLLLGGAPIVRGRAHAERLLSERAAVGATRVRWLPLIALVSADGSLGVTWGVTTIADKADLRFGKYVSVWRREGDEWRIVAHVQTGLPEHSTAVPEAEARGFAAGAGALFAAADSAFARMAADSGAPAAFAAFAAPTAVTFPESGELVIGPEAIRARMQEHRARSAWSWAPRFAGGSGGGDLGFTVGEATITSTAGGIASTFYSKYLTVWRRLPDGSIRFLADAGNARPRASH